MWYLTVNDQYFLKGELKELLEEQPDLTDTSQGKIAWKGDALNQILGEEKQGRVHGLGLVPNPNKVFDLSKSRRFKNINLTSLDPTTSDDVQSLRLQPEKIEKHVQNQDATIIQLKQKTTPMEERQVDQVISNNLSLIHHFCTNSLNLCYRGS